MKHLHGFVNVVPVIAKADTLTIEERDSFKQRIKEDLHFHGINIYPTAYGAEDEEDAAANHKIEVSTSVSVPPFFSLSATLYLNNPNIGTKLDKNNDTRISERCHVPTFLSITLQFFALDFCPLFSLLSLSLSPSLPLPLPPRQQYIPFAVIGSDREVAVGGKKLLGRQTKWGFIEVENRKHCEFSQLRDMLIKLVTTPPLTPSQRNNVCIKPSCFICDNLHRSFKLCSLVHALPIDHEMMSSLHHIQLLFPNGV